MKIVIVKKRFLRQKYHFCLVAQNGKILASSENYYNLTDCIAAAKIIQREAHLANIHE